MVGSLHSQRYRVFLEMLVEARERTKLTQDEVAARMGKTQSFVSKSERGARRIDFVEFLEFAEALSIDVPAFIEQYRARVGLDKKGR